MDRIKQWIDQWHPRPAAPPDKFEKYDNHYLAVWYSNKVGIGVNERYGVTPQPQEESVFVSMVELSREAFIVTEYTHVSEWYMDEPWVAAEHGDFWRTQSVELDPAKVRAAFLAAVQKDRALEMPRDPLMTARWVMPLGSARISYMGGDEDEAQSLP